MSQNPKTLLDSGTCFGFWEVFCDSGTCFGFWDMLWMDMFWILGRVLDSGMFFGFWDMFWILGCVLHSKKSFVPMSQGSNEFSDTKLLEKSKFFPVMNFS